MGVKKLGFKILDLGFKNQKSKITNLKLIIGGIYDEK